MFSRKHPAALAAFDRELTNDPEAAEIIDGLKAEVEALQRKAVAANLSAEERDDARLRRDASEDLLWRMYDAVWARVEGAA